MLERLVPPELTPGSRFSIGDDNMDNMTRNTTMKLARELTKTSFLPPLAQIGRL